MLDTLVHSGLRRNVLERMRAASFCEMRTSIPSGAALNLSMPCLKICIGWVSSGTKGPIVVVPMHHTHRANADRNTFRHGGDFGMKAGYIPALVRARIWRSRPLHRMTPTMNQSIRERAVRVPIQQN